MQGEHVPLTQRYFKSDVYDAYDCERMIRGLKVTGLWPKKTQHSAELTAFAFADRGCSRQ